MKVNANKEISATKNIQAKQQKLFGMKWIVLEGWNHWQKQWCLISAPPFDCVSICFKLQKTLNYNRFLIYWQYVKFVWLKYQELLIAE